MMKIVFATLFLLGICCDLFAQSSDSTLMFLFNNNDLTTPIDNERYFTAPSESFTHAQLMDLPASNQAELLHKVLIIVDSSLYSVLNYEINRYAYDIHYVYGCNVIMEQINSETCQDIKGLIIYYHNNLDGCVLIGDIVPAFYETDKDYASPNSYDSINWPCDLYYMDLTGNWTDINHNNIFDTYTGDKRPEIFLGRISTSNMGNLIGEIEGIRLYLKKNHNYWIGHRHINKKYALSYTNKDWVKPNQINVTNNFRHSISALYGSNNYEHIDERANSDVFGKTDYRQRLQNEKYEFIQLASHSRDTAHFNFGQYNDTILGNEVFSYSIKNLGFNLFCCSACRWTSSSSTNAFLAGDYIYSPNSEGLCVVGSTKIGGMYPFAAFYSSLGQGKTMGQALIDWWSSYSMPSYTQQQILCWNFGLTIIGDPLVNFFHCTNNTCIDHLTLTSYDSANSPLSYYLTSESILVSPSTGWFAIPQGDHCILNSPSVLIKGSFECPIGSSLEILNEGCMQNCDE